MKENNILYQGEKCDYQNVVKAQDKKLLEACEEAVQILCNSNWKSMGYQERVLFPRAEFKVKSFVDCKVVVLNDEGTITATLVGKKSSKSLYNDFCIDMATHPKVGESLLKERFSAEAYLKDKYAK